MNFKLRVWRQENPKSKGKLVAYEAADISPNTSLLEMGSSGNLVADNRVEMGRRVGDEGK